MNWLSDDHVGKSHPPVRYTIDQHCVLKSKILMPPVGPVYNPAMKRPP